MRSQNTHKELGFGFCGFCGFCGLFALVCEIGREADLLTFWTKLTNSVSSIFQLLMIATMGLNLIALEALSIRTADERMYGSREMHQER